MLAAVDARAADVGASRAETIRTMLSEVLAAHASSGVDTAQPQRMLRMTPRQRVEHAAAAARQLPHLGAAAGP